MKKRIALILMVMMALVFLTGCIPGDGKASLENPAGFFWGVWHGWIAPVSLILSIFRDPYRLYEPFNTGFGYDLAFYLAVVGGFGSLSFFRRKKKKD